MSSAGTIKMTARQFLDLGEDPAGVGRDQKSGQAVNGLRINSCHSERTREESGFGRQGQIPREYARDDGVWSGPSARKNGHAPGVRLELVNGEVAVSPSPIPEHSYVVGALHLILDQHIKNHRLGEPLSQAND